MLHPFRRLRLARPHRARRTRHRRPILSAGAGLALAAAATAHAADSPRPLVDRTAHLLERAALMDLGLLDNPWPADYRLAALVLELAERLAPDDAELVRRVVAAAWASGDEDLLIEATTRLLRLDPGDTVAQLRLITARIGRLQTAEERLEAYGRFLGDAGRAFDPAVRSRLALDAALIHREQGDNGAFAARLADAMRLDISNKDAASLAVTYSAGNVGPAERLELKTNLLYADPFDPHVHHAIAALLWEAHLFRQAHRFLGNTVRLLEVSRGDPGDTIRSQALMLSWHNDGPEPVAERLSRAIAVQRESAAAEVARLEERREPVDPRIRPENVYLPLDLERIRLLAAASAEERAKVEASMRDFQSSVEMLLAPMLADAERELSRDELSAFLAYYFELQLLRLMTNVDVEDIEPAVDRIVQTIPGAEELMRALRPWILLRSGRAEDAIELHRRSGRRDAASLAAEAASLEALGRLDEAGRLYARIFRATPMTPIGAWARIRAESVGTRPERPAHSEAVERFVADIPRWIDDMIRQPSTAMSLSIRSTGNSFRASEPATVRIRLRNLAPIPLAVGSDRPLGSRMLLTTRLDQSLEGFVGDPLPTVIELDRRLRLRPREEIEITVRADAPYTEYILETNSALTNRQRWRLLQNFALGPRGTLTTGPMGLGTETPTVVRLPVADTRLDLHGLVQRIGSAGSAALPDTLVAARARLLGPLHADAGSQRGAAEVAAAVAARFDSGPTLERAVILLSMPHAGLVPELDRLERVARASLLDGGRTLRDDASELLTVIMLLTRVRSDEDPLLEAAIAGENARIAEIASILHQRVREGRRTLGAVEQGIEGFSGATPRSLRPRGAQ